MDEIDNIFKRKRCCFSLCLLTFALLSQVARLCECIDPLAEPSRSKRSPSSSHFGPYLDVLPSLEQVEDDNSEGGPYRTRIMTPSRAQLSHYYRSRGFLVPDSSGQDAYPDRDRRKFPEVDARGFDEDIFDEGFGEFHPMKRWPH